MKQVVLTIDKNVQIARDCYRMELVGDISAITAPGQFLNFQITGRYLRRPISICDAENGRAPEAGLSLCKAGRKARRWL